MQVIRWQSMPGPIQQSKRNNDTPRDRTPQSYKDIIKRLENRIAAKEKKILKLQKEAWVDPKDPLHCLRCDHRVSRLEYISSHMCWPGHPSMSVTVPPTYCEPCDRNFADRNSLQRHKKICKGAKGKDSTANKGAQVKATVRKGADGLHPQSEVYLSMSSQRTMSEKHGDMGSAYDAPGSFSDIDCARGIDGNAVFFGPFSNDPTPPFHHGAPLGLGGTSPTTSATAPIEQHQDPNSTSYPVSFPLGYVKTGDQGKAFFQDPISTYKFGGEYGGQNAIYNAPPIDQSHVFLEDPFGTRYAGDGNVASLPRYEFMTDEGQAFSENPYMTPHHSHGMAFAGPGLDFSQILQSAGS